MSKKDEENELPALVLNEGNSRRLDCYEFCLLSLGELYSPDGEREDPWDYVEEKDGGDIHGYQII